ncbi:MAG: ABC transporter permease [Oscillospiraceae bacterium]|nr:ABC transporter permease [Oscillospiraceae bacterium]
MTAAKSVAAIVARMLILLAMVSILAFVLVINSPIDPLVSYIGPESTLSQEARQEITEYWSLDKSGTERYLQWVKNILSGDFGVSITYKRPVIGVIGERFACSVALMATAWVFSGVLGFLLGLAAGTRQGSFFDKTVRLFCLVLQSSPPFWVGLLVLSIFAVNLGWFPIGLAVPMGKLASEVTFADRIHHLILPMATLTIASMGKIALFTRQKAADIAGSEFVLFGLARGFEGGGLMRRHILRNAAFPAITLQFSSFSELFGGLVLAETVFSYPGIGSAAVAAALGSDVPLLLGITLFSAIFVFCGNLVANLLYKAADPSLRGGSECV